MGVVIRVFDPSIFHLTQKVLKKLMIPAAAVLILIAGLVFMLIPFIPLGWPLVGLAALLLTPYIKLMRRFISWLAKKDKTGFLKKAGRKAEQLYKWAGDHKSARRLRAALENTRSIRRVLNNEVS
jgi:type III secretory pathway component EscV